MIPEHSAKIEEIESTITWIGIFSKHTRTEAKRLLMELHAFGEISDDKLDALFSILQLRNA